MTPADLSRCVVRAVRRAVEDGELPVGIEVPARVVVERTRPGGVGDYATPVAFQVAKAARRAPGEVAGVLARRLAAEPGVERADVTGAGFLNFTLAPRSAAALVRDIHARGSRYGYAHGAAVETEPAYSDPAIGLRERAVHEAVVRLLRSQGQEADGGPWAGIAPVAKRDGDVRARYGTDAAVWAVLSVPARETPVFSYDLLVQGESSEFFRVRYAYARCRALVRNAAEWGFSAEAGDVADAPELVRALADYPLVLEAAAHHRAPERLVRHLVELADALLDFQYRVLPKGDEKPSAAHRARLALAEAAGTVLAGGLALLGIDAPERL
ncbi:ArgS-related anticodon-binding protein NrtL [Streptomyces sp. NPDC048337]|uniref:ArgS-related anticodon-binding protein NrtL n=1 Tax=Streptomyces sp. NPDC048337 TaxID=3365535 RepID=UPI00371E02FA